MKQELLDLITQYGDARASGDTKAGELHGQLRDALAASLPTPGDNLTERKTRSILTDDPAFELTGYVLRRNDGKACIISRSAVRWLDADQFDGMMRWQPDYSPLTKTLKKPCRYPLCQSEEEQARIASQVHAELYSGEPVPEDTPVAYTTKEDLVRIQSGAKIGTIFLHEKFRDKTDIKLYTRPVNPQVACDCTGKVSGEPDAF